MEFLTHFLTLPISDPVLIFCLVLLIILLAPLVFERLHIPNIVGLILSGIVLGPYALHVLKYDASFQLLGQVGLLYIMFMAGIDMDRNDFRQNRFSSALFGFFTFVIPMLLGLVVGTCLVYMIYTQMGGTAISWLDHSPSTQASLLRYSFLSALVLSSMFASNTLLAYPLVGRFGVTRNRSVNISVGGTMITTILALMVLAISLGIIRGELNSHFWIRFGISVALLAFILIFLYPRIGRLFFKHCDDPVLQYIFILAMVFLASFLAKLSGLEYILGAFLAGVSLSPLVPKQSTLQNRIHFVGNSIFIPFFLISVGMVVDIRVFLNGALTWITAATMVVVATLSKYLAAVATKHSLKLNKDEGWMLFGLSNAHAAAALAVVVIGYNLVIGYAPNGFAVRLLTEEILGGTVLMILVSCIISSVVTERASRHLAITIETPQEDLKYNPEHRILIPLANPQTMNGLLNLALLFKTRKEAHPIYALHVVDENNQNSQKTITGKRMLEEAKNIGAASDSLVKKITRYDLNITSGISNVVLEKNISDIIMGCHPHNLANTYFDSNPLDSLLHKINRMIFIYHEAQPLTTIRRLLVVVPENAEFESGFDKWCSRLFTLGSQAGVQKIMFYSNTETMVELRNQMHKQRCSIKSSHHYFSDWSNIDAVCREASGNDLVVWILARKTSLSYVPAFEKIAQTVAQHLPQNSYILLYPEQFKEGELEQIEERNKII